MRAPSRLASTFAGTLLSMGLFVLDGPQSQADDLSTIRHRGTLIVGVKVDYHPFGYRSPSGEIVGIEPALAADVAKSLGVGLQLVPVLPLNRIDLLKQGKIDLIIATMNDTMGRRSEVEIVKPYYYAAGYNVMVPKSMDLKSWADLKGKTVCGIQDAYYNYEVEKNFELHVTTFADVTDAITALQQAHCVGLLYDDAWIKGDLLEPGWSGYDMPLESQEVQPWGLAVRKGQPDWSHYLSAVVGKWLRDGTILDLETAYHIKHAKFAEDAHHRASAPSSE